MTKVAIKNESITSFGRINHIMDVFSKLGFEKLTESVLGRRGCSGKAFSHGSILSSLFFSYLCVKIVQNISMRLQDSSTRAWHTATLCWPYQHWTSTEIYNEHKTSEKNIDIQNIDFGSSHLPLFFYDWKYSFYDEYCWIQTK